MLLRRLALAAIAATLPTALVACGGPEPVKVGDVIPARHAKQFSSGTTSRLLLPTGRLTVHLGEPVAAVAEGQTAQREALDAPKDAVFVPITWNFDTDYFKSLQEYVGTQTTPVVDLTIGGDSYRLPAPSNDGPRSFYVPVTGDASTVVDDAGLSVGFMDVKQTVDLTTAKRHPGAARGLYRLDRKRPARTDCSDRWTSLPAGVADFSCRASVPIRLPFAGGRWAPRGQEFIATTLQTSLNGFAAGDYTGVGYYAAQSVEAQLLVDGEAPLSEIPSREAEAGCPEMGTAVCSFETNVVFAVSTDLTRPQLQVQQTYRLLLTTKSGDYDGRKRLTMRAIGRLPLG